MSSQRQADSTPRRPQLALELDHLGYQVDRGYRRQTLIALRRAGRRKRSLNLTVLHEGDDSCCQREGWPTTLARIIDALLADGVPIGVLDSDVLVLAQPEGA